MRSLSYAAAADEESAAPIPRVNLPLLSLHLRRAVNPWLGLALALVVALLASMDQAPAEVGLGVEDPEQAARGLLRDAWWTTLSLVALAGVVGATAGEFTRWRRSDALWVSTRSRGALTIAASVWAGRALGTCAWLLAIGFVTELAAGGSEPSYEVGRARAVSAQQSDPALAAFGWKSDLGQLHPDARVRVQLHWRGDYSSVSSLELRVARMDGERLVQRARPELTQRIELRLPAGSGPLEFELVALDAASRLAVEDLTLEVLRPTSERVAVLRIAMSLALFGATLIALVLGFGSWMSAPSAFCLVGVLWIAAWLEGASAPLPGLALPRLFASLSDGRVPMSEPALVWLASAALVALGLGLHVAALRKGMAP
jgi:hypothetical protein